MMHYLRSILMRAGICWCILSMLLSTSCGYDATPLYQQAQGTWKLVAVDDLIGDAVPERLPGEDVTLILTAQATYIQTFSVSNNSYSGIYTISDPTHITFTEQRTPTNLSRPPYTVEFQIQNDKLILTDISRETYQRSGP